MAFEKIIIPFAENGDRETIPQTAPLNGAVNFGEGYGSNYDLALSSPGALPIERDSFNQIINTITGNIQDWQENTYPLYVTAAQNGGTAVTYPVGTRVRYDDGNGVLVYRAINSSGASSVPTTSGDWVVDSAASGSGSFTLNAAVAPSGNVVLSSSIAGLELPDGVPLYFMPTSNGTSGLIDLERSGETTLTIPLPYGFRAGELYAAVLNGENFFIMSVSDVARRDRIPRPQWISAEQIGNTQTIATTNPSISALNGTDIAALDDTLNTLTARRFNGTTFSIVGTAFSVTNLSNAKIAAIDSNDVVIANPNDNTLRRYRFNVLTEVWSEVGTAFVITGGLNTPAIASFGEGRIVLVNHFNNSIRVYSTTNSGFSTVGSQVNFVSLLITDLSAFSSTEFVAVDTVQGDAIIYRFDENTFSLRATLGISAPSSPSVECINETDFVVIDGSNDAVRVYRYSASGINPATPFFQITGDVGITSITSFNGMDLVYNDGLSDNLVVFRLGFAPEPPFKFSYF